MSYHYLGSPYSHKNPAVRHARYLAARQTLQEYLERRVWTYSPIVHCHHLAVEGGLPTDAKFWEEYDFAMVRASKGLLVLMLPGWAESVGLGGEIEYAREALISVTYIIPSVKAQELLGKITGDYGGA